MYLKTQRFGDRRQETETETESVSEMLFWNISRTMDNVEKYSICSYETVSHIFSALIIAGSMHSA
jgi:hypothetical protein